MGKLAVQKYFSFMILIITLMMMIFTIVGLFGGETNPSGNMARALLVYVLPLLIAGNVILLIYWLILRRWHWALMPFITLLCCIPYIGTLYQFRGIDENADKQAGLKIATYNVANFGHEASGFIAQDVLAEMKKQKVDVFCIQEYSSHSGDKNNEESYKEYFPYVAYGCNGHMATFSRYPIKDSAPIEFPASANGAMWIDIDVNGQMFRVYNVHLETAGAHHVYYRANKMEEDGITVKLEEVTATISANTPVVLENTTEENFTKDFFGKSTATKNTYTVGLLTGVYNNSADNPYTIPASTEETVNYVLQTQPAGHNRHQCRFHTAWW